MAIIEVKRKQNIFLKEEKGKRMKRIAERSHINGKHDNYE